MTRRFPEPVPFGGGSSGFDSWAWEFSFSALSSSYPLLPGYLVTKGIRFGQEVVKGVD